MPSITKLIKNPTKVVFLLDKVGASRLIPDRVYLKLKYRASVGKKLNLKDPKTYNEKLQWLKLYDRNPQYTKLVDKYEVKSYVAEKIGQRYIIPTLGVWDRVEDIDFDALPEQFVLKCTHDSGGLVICKDKSQLNIEEAKRKLKRSLKNNFYYQGREWPYKNVKPRILAEKFMEDVETGELRDYKFFCFDGVAKAVRVDTERSTGNVKMDFFDRELNHLPFERNHQNAKITPEIPPNFEEMVKIADRLSKGFCHLRVDLYSVNGAIYFGELTFFAANGFAPFYPDEWDAIFGDWIKLPEK